MKKIIEWFINLYAIWIILAFIVGYLYPGAFMWFTKGSWMTLALAVDGSFAWSMVPGYIVAQFAGAFVGAAVVYLLFKGQFDATEDQATKLGVFCTAPSIPNLGLNIFSEAVGTFILAFLLLFYYKEEDLDRIFHS